MHRTHLPVLALTALLSACVSDLPRSDAPWRIEQEVISSWQTRNDVRIPNDEGTRFALDELVGSGPEFNRRTTVEVDLDGRNGLRLVVAPLEFDGSGQFDEPVEFQGETFAAGRDTAGRYRFDTYRLTWRYLMDESETYSWQLGATLLVRDAEIGLRQERGPDDELDQGPLRAKDDNVGLVPLLHAAAEQRFASDWSLVGVLDAAVASQGRAIEGSLALRYDAGENWDVSLGYRILEGGADNDTVYSFATIHTVFFGVAASF